MIQPNNSDDPICPVHETLMLSHKFEPWEVKAVRGNVHGFKCSNLSCSVVYFDDLERFFVIKDSILTPFTKSAAH